MKRRKALKSIGAVSALAFVPLGLSAKEERMSSAGVIIDPEKAKVVVQVYPQGWQFEIKIGDIEWKTYPDPDNSEGLISFCEWTSPNKDVWRSRFGRHSFPFTREQVDHKKKLFIKSINRENGRT